MARAIGIGYEMSKKETSTLFTVIGQGEFPLDMLRYDGCYPQCESDSATMRKDGLREVTLQKTLDRGHPNRSHRIWSPTVGRWNSFGWAVLGELPAWAFAEGVLMHNTMLATGRRRKLRRQAGPHEPQPDAKIGSTRVFFGKLDG